MEKYKILSGEEIVAKGATKIEVTLPEVGLKDVTPDGSWLQQKQTQSALEARKHLVEVPRIEKSGVLSHAEWQDELKLAEVTQQLGGYWQFLGHHRDKKLYLTPEEALYLIEVNCLLLKYNGVKVSLQQAYSLLLSDDMSIIQYKVYSSLSRLGYKVFKHVFKTVEEQTGQKNKEEREKDNKSSQDENNETEKSLNVSKCTESVELTEDISILMDVETPHEVNDVNDGKVNEENTTIEDEEKKNVEQSLSKTHDNETNHKINKDERRETDHSTDESKEDNYLAIEVDKNKENQTDILGVQTSDGTCLLNQKQVPNDTIGGNQLDSEACSSSHSNNNINKDPLRRYCHWKLQKLKCRQQKGCKASDNHKHFENCPDVLENQIVSVKVPNEEFIPKNIFLNNLCYVLNVENIRKKNNTPPTTESTYTLTDEVNGAHIRRVTSSSLFDQTNPQPRPHSLPHFFQNFRPNIPFRHFGYFRPRTNTHYFQFNLFYQRPFMSNINPRFQFYPRTHIPMFPEYSNNLTNSPNNDLTPNSPSNERKRTRDSPKKLHFNAIKNLAAKLRNLAQFGNMRPENIEALQKIINTYNERYITRLRLTQEYEIVNDETIVDTIELVDDDDEESKSKKPRLADKSDLFHENLDKIRQIARKLKILESQNKTSTRHRRALSSLIKTFNKSFNADIYMTDNSEVLDRRHISLDSDSDSDCVVEVSPKLTGKKLRNPFNILKRLSLKQVGTTTSQQKSADSQSTSNPFDLYEALKNTFKRPWLPDKDDFGRPEIIPSDTMTARIMETKKNEYIYDFFKDQISNYNSWVDIKIAFLENIEDTNAILDTEAMMDNNIDLRSLVKPDDCTDMSSVLRKLRIIKNNSETNQECSLAIHFDVYNRDVQNFRKSSRPKPHFRILCLDEASPCPRGIDLATLHAKYEDDVAILVAVVGVGSISYVQMNPIDLPVYVPSNDLG